MSNYRQLTTQEIKALKENGVVRIIGQIFKLPISLHPTIYQTPNSQAKYDWGF